MATAQSRPNEPTEADITQALCTLTRETLGFSVKMMNALEAGRPHFPLEARVAVDELSKSFRAVAAKTEAVLVKVAA